MSETLKLRLDEARIQSSFFSILSRKYFYLFNIKSLVIEKMDCLSVVFIVLM